MRVRKTTHNIMLYFLHLFLLIYKHLFICNHPFHCINIANFQLTISHNIVAHCGGLTEPSPSLIQTTVRYVNQVVELLHNPGDVAIYQAPTCGHYDTDYQVTVRVYDPHNPSHNPNLGIPYFAVSNTLYTNGVSINTKHTSF